MNSQLLTSWKEIAQHLGKSVRTVQRWERELGLPVRRPKNGSASIVLADRDELTAWAHQQNRAAVASRELELIQLRERCALLEGEIVSLRARCEQLETVPRRSGAKPTESLAN